MLSFYLFFVELSFCQWFNMICREWGEFVFFAEVYIFRACFLCVGWLCWGRECVFHMLEQLSPYGRRGDV